MPRRLRLTGATVERLAPEQSEYTVWDARTAGLGVRIRPSGARSYVYLGRVGTDAAIRRRTLGPAARMSIDDARCAILVLQTAARDPRSSDGGTPGRVTFREFVEATWGPAFLGRYKPSSRRSVDTCLRTQLLPEFGEVPLERISPGAVHRWFDGYSATAPSGANHALKQFRVILRYAVRCGHLSRDPTRTVRPNPRARVTRFLSGEELERLHRALDACVRERPARAAQADIVRLLLVTGCRHGEIRNLRWDEVHGDTLRLHDSKTGPRTVFLNAEARRILARQERNASRYVFPSPLDPARPRSCTLSVWSLARRRAGLEDVRLHDCRHTFASQAVLRGVPIPVVARLLGHRNASMTMRYAHVRDPDVEAAAERVGTAMHALLGGRNCRPHGFPSDGP